MEWERDDTGIERALADYCEAQRQGRRETVRPHSQELIVALPLESVLQMAASAA